MEHLVSLTQYYTELLERENVVSKMTILQTLLPMITVFATGITSGFLSAVSFLDVRTFAELINKKDAQR